MRRGGCTHRSWTQTCLRTRECLWTRGCSPHLRLIAVCASLRSSPPRCHRATQPRLCSKACSCLQRFECANAMLWIYVYMNIYIYISFYTHTHIYIYIFINTYIYMYICIYIYIYIYIHSLFFLYIYIIRNYVSVFIFIDRDIFTFHFKFTIRLSRRVRSATKYGVAIAPPPTVQLSRRIELSCRIGSRRESNRIVGRRWQSHHRRLFNGSLPKAPTIDIIIWFSISSYLYI